jgi:hypothetical protein
MFSFLYHRNTSYAGPSPPQRQKCNGIVDTGRRFPALLATTSVRTNCEGARQPPDLVADTAPSQESDAIVWKLPEGIEDLLADGESNIPCTQSRLASRNKVRSQTKGHRSRCVTSRFATFAFPRNASNLNSLAQFPLLCSVMPMKHASCYQSRFRHCSGRCGGDDSLP